ncbi:ABC transporter ATP-binding protein [Treponema pedis]|uniref:ABC transporter ATP-binding protein n=1 Tax=Treponema pedis TaxID=409322 RepID=UPI000425F455|nr:ABC transporter ATP-binding protein [Treponema pedis]
MNKKSQGILEHIFSVTEKGRGILTAGITASVIGMLCNVVPYISVYYIGKLFLTDGVSNNKGAILFWVLIAGAAILLNLVFSFCGSLGCHTAAFKILYRYRIKIMEHLGKLPIGFFAEYTSGGIQKIMDEDIGKLEGVIAHIMPDMIGSTLVLLLLLAGIGYLNIFLALAVILSIAAGFFFQFSIFGGEKAKQIYADVTQSAQNITGAFSEYVKGIAEVKLFGKTHGMTKTLEKYIDDYEFWEVTSYKRAAFNMTMYKSIGLSLLTFVLPAGGFLITYSPTGDTVLSVLMALIITPALWEPLLTCIDYAAQLRMTQAGLQQIELILNSPVFDFKPEQKRIAHNSVEFENVSFSYQSETDSGRHKALDSISFSCNEGEMTALVGESGSGKSTVGQLLLRFYDIHQGRITIGGKDIRTIETKELMDKIAFVFQDTFIFSDTVKNNIIMNKNIPEEKLIEAAKQACCHDFIMKLPEGYDTLIGSGNIQLSGGEAQRISIARAFLKESPIIILDEALAYTDAENENVIQEAIKNLIKHKTVIVIAHRLQSIMEADNIIVLQNGKIIERGTHTELMSKNTEYKTLWKLQYEADEWELEHRGEAIQ